MPERDTAPHRYQTRQQGTVPGSKATLPPIVPINFVMEADALSRIANFRRGALEDAVIGLVVENFRAGTPNTS